MSLEFSLNLLINTIVTDYFESHCVFVFTEPTKTATLFKINRPSVNIHIVNSTVDEDLVFRSHGCQDFIIQCENVAEFIKNFEDRIKLQADRFNYRKYLILPTFSTEENSLMEVFGAPFLQYITNLLIVLPENRTEVICKTQFEVDCSQEQNFLLLTHKYVGRRHNNDLEVLDYWFSNNSRFFYGNNLFPDKISNQQGRVLRCATFNYEPYSIIERSQYIARGSENLVAHEYAKRCNMTIRYVLDDQEWGIIYDNWTGNGILGNIAIDKADIGYGALYTWAHEYSFLDLSKPVVRTGVTCLVPAPQLAAGWLTPFLPFSLEMWIAIGISFLAMAIVTVYITIFLGKNKMKDLSHYNEDASYGKITDDSFLKITRIFLLQSLPHERVDTISKYIFVAFLTSLIITSTYSSGLATVMTIPRYKGAIKTALDLANSGLHWGATQDAWIFSIMSETRPQYITIVQRFIPTTEQNLIEYAKTNQFAFSIERLPSGQYAIGNYITEKVVQNLRLMNEDLYWEYCVFMTRKNSPLLDSLDNFILLLAQSGLIHHWEMMAAQIHMDLRVQNIVHYYTMVQKEDAGSTVKLQWIHVEGTFGILAIGYIISTLVFLLEIVRYKRYSKNLLNKRSI